MRRPPDGQFPRVGFANPGAASHELIARGTVGVQCGENGLFDLLHIYCSVS